MKTTNGQGLFVHFYGPPFLLKNTLPSLRYCTFHFAATKAQPLKYKGMRASCTQNNTMESVQKKGALWSKNAIYYHICCTCPIHNFLLFSLISFTFLKISRSDHCLKESLKGGQDDIFPYRLYCTCKSTINLRVKCTSAHTVLQRSFFSAKDSCILTGHENKQKRPNTNLYFCSS